MRAGYTKDTHQQQQGKSHTGHYAQLRSDQNWFDTSYYSGNESPKGRRGYYTFSDFVTMSDGVRIAVDVYLPVNYLKPHQQVTYRTQEDTFISRKYPTMLHFTRYNRNWKVRWPFNYFLRSDRLNMRTMSSVEQFVIEPTAMQEWRSEQQQGIGRGKSADLGTVDTDESWNNPPAYAYVTVDVRGTGASFGVRHVDFAEREKTDFQVCFHC